MRTREALADGFEMAAKARSIRARDFSGRMRRALEDDAADAAGEARRMRDAAESGAPDPLPGFAALVGIAGTT